MESKAEIYHHSIVVPTTFYNINMCICLLGDVNTLSYLISGPWSFTCDTYTLQSLRTYVVIFKNQKY